MSPAPPTPACGLKSAFQKMLRKPLAEHHAGRGKKSGLALRRRICDCFPMPQVADLLREASKLDRIDRAELVSSLLEDLDPDPHCVTDEEALERLEELKSGKVKGLSEEEFWKACGRT